MKINSTVIKRELAEGMSVFEQIPNRQKSHKAQTLRDLINELKHTKKEEVFVTVCR